MIVIDASVLVNALADDTADGDRARARLLADPDLHAPSLIDVEVLSVLRRHLNAGTLDDRRADLAINDLIALPLIRYPHVAIARLIWAHRNNLTAYDATYVALAELLDCPLVTTDRKLANAPGLTCPVEHLR
ncbi:MAG: type II toxin-antitoxin system VapC family toxin [Pseudonocardiaceae bacterium]